MVYKKIIRYCEENNISISALEKNAISETGLLGNGKRVVNLRLTLWKKFQR